MEGHREELSMARAVKVESAESWDSYLTEANNQNSPVVVHFTASWCMPSVAMDSVFEESASTYNDALFLVVDVDELKEVATKMGIKAMPTFLLMKNGSLVDKLVGANPEEIKKRIDSFVKSFRIYIA